MIELSILSKKNSLFVKFLNVADTSKYLKYPDICAKVCLLSYHLQKVLVGDHRNKEVGMGKWQREGMLLLRYEPMTK